MSPRLATTVESCTAAALSTDARDKYFLSYVGEGSPGGAAFRAGMERGRSGEVSELIQICVCGLNGSSSIEMHCGHFAFRTRERIVALRLVK